MAGYVPYHGKKFDRLKRVEADLTRLIERHAARDELLAAADEVRDCRIRVLKARQNQIPERTAAERAAFLKLQARIQALQATTAEKVLAEFFLGRPEARLTGLVKNFTNLLKTFDSSAAPRLA